MTKEISIARDFSPYPAGRFESDGPHSGEVFLKKLLIPALEAGSVNVDLDGVAGLPSSFLEEITGGLVRRGYKLSQLRDKLRFIAHSSRMESYPEQARRYLEEADKNPKSQVA